MIEFFGTLPSYTLRATVWEIDGKVVAMIGYWMIAGQAVVFSDIDPLAEAPAIRIWREAKAFMDNLKHDARCVAQEGSERFLESLGWQHIGTSDDGEIFEWHS